MQCPLACKNQVKIDELNEDLTQLRRRLFVVVEKLGARTALLKEILSKVELNRDLAERINEELRA